MAEAGKRTKGRWVVWVWLGMLFVGGFGCATVEESGKGPLGEKEVPAWYGTSRLEGGGMVHGMGSGRTELAAIQKGLVGVASRLGISVGVQWEQIQQSHGDGEEERYTEEAIQRSRHEVMEVTFNRYSIERKDYVDGVWYVEVGVNLSEVVSGWRGELSDDLDAAEAALDAAMGEGDLVRKLSHLRGCAGRLVEGAEWKERLDRAGEATEEQQRWLELMQKLGRMEREWKGKLGWVVQVNGGLEEVGEGLEKVIREKGYSVGGASDVEQVMEVLVSGEMKVGRNLDRFVALLEVGIGVRSADGREYGHERFSVQGMSRLGEESAKANAQRRVLEVIRQMSSTGKLLENF